VTEVANRTKLATVIGYGRVSTEEQQDNFSLDAQRSRYEQFCKQRGIVSTEFQQEVGSGASIVARPMLVSVLEKIKSGAVDALWVKELDRLSRPENLGDLSYLAHVFVCTSSCRQTRCSLSTIRNST